MTRTPERELAAVLRAEAQALLERVEAASPGFVVEATGSYALDLMTWRDLDIHIPTEGRSVDDFFEVGQRLLGALSPHRMTFKDHRVQPEDGWLYGLYWGLRCNHEGAEWKVDVWGFDDAVLADRRAHLQSIRGRLTPETRNTILQLKASLWTHPAYRKTVSSQDIYDAVLGAGVTTLEAFWRYVAARRPSH